jgi:hypothetical protein
MRQSLEGIRGRQKDANPQICMSVNRFKAAQSVGMHQA